MGMLARTYIPQGGVVLVEHPVLVLPTNMALDASVFGLEESGSYHKALISHLDDQVKREIYSLKNCSTSVNGSTPMGIFATNALNIELEVNDNGLRSQDKKYQALFLKTSRCNHSCGPNAIWRFDRLTFTLTLSTVRDIHLGEEITISYVDPFLPRHVRRTQLQSKWNLLCHCMYCDVPWTFPGAISQSDKARYELKTFFKKLPDWEQWCLDGKNKEKEGLEGFRGVDIAGNSKDVAYMKHIDALVMCYGALANAKEFRKWVNKAREVKLAEGSDSVRAHVKVLDIWLREPGKFHVWGWKRS
ncbi:hypothetical protein F5051DRAFT_376863 [Lentinula edodes]|nr:hypothetical protein F5051DRAFT_376863 [Lentinula edodes]